MTHYTLLFSLNSKLLQRYQITRIKTLSFIHFPIYFKLSENTKIIPISSLANLL